MNAQLVDPPGCFSNGDCTAAETQLKCPDCSQSHWENEPQSGYEDEKFIPPQDTGVTLPSVSPSPSPSPVVEESFTIRPFILLLIFVLVGLIVGYVVFRIRKLQTPQ